MPAGKTYREQSQRYNKDLFVKVLNVVNEGKASIAGDQFPWKLQNVYASVFLSQQILTS